MLTTLRIGSAAVFVFAASTALAGTLSEDARQRLLAAYPEQLERIDGNTLVWRDGTRMPLDDGKDEKTFKEWLDNPDIEDMLAVAYPEGDLNTPPAKDVDPGRARNAAFFDKVYGNCRKGEVSKNLTRIVWLPKKASQRLPFNKANGAARALKAVSGELDALPSRFDVFLYPSAGTYNCRTIAGTKRKSAHGHGIAIDIALKHSDYWRNAKPGKDGAYPYKNEIPMEIVRIFERHGFIWGGKWHHYDTMHFEYRPELVGHPAGPGN
jgi:hypothetical protein